MNLKKRYIISEEIRFDFHYYINDMRHRKTDYKSSFKEK